MITQDAGFGRLAFLEVKRCPGVIILRPGQLRKTVIVDTLRRLFDNFPVVEQPFLVVVVRTGDDLQIRPRTLS